MVEIAALRAKLKWSQADMAAFLGCHQSTVDRIEGGQTASRTVARLLTRLDVLVHAGTALPGQSVETILHLALGRSPVAISPISTQPSSTQSA